MNKEIVEDLGKLDEVIVKTTIRKKGAKRRIREYYDACPSRTDPTGRWETDINHLIKKYSPDELAMYLAARNTHRQEITNHDFSNEPTLQDARHQLYKIGKVFENLPPEVKGRFGTPLEFMKFMDNPDNEEIMTKLGFVKKKDMESVKDPTVIPEKDDVTPTTKEAKETKTDDR